MNYLTVKEAAEKLRYTGAHAENSARKFLWRKGIPRKRRGKVWLVKESDVQAVLDGKSWKKSEPVQIAGGQS